MSWSLVVITAVAALFFALGIVRIGSRAEFELFCLMILYVASSAALLYTTLTPTGYVSIMVCLLAPIAFAAIGMGWSLVLFLTYLLSLCGVALVGLRLREGRHVQVDRARKVFTLLWFSLAGFLPLASIGIPGIAGVVDGYSQVLVALMVVFSILYYVQLFFSSMSRIPAGRLGGLGETPIDYFLRKSHGHKPG